jgi:sugar phosphate permease
MRVAANWVPAQRRGRAIGILGTSYQVSAAMTFVVAGWAADRLGWRGAFYVPALVLAAAGLHMLVCLREAPDASVANGNGVGLQRAPPHRDGGWFDNVRLTLTNPGLWVLALALMFLDAARYGFMDWGLAHLKDIQEGGVGMTAMKYAILPTGGIAGAFLAGWATDRFFGGRRAPVICGLLVLLGVLTLLYEPVARQSVPGTIILLAAIGFAILGPQVLLVGTAPADLARRGTAAAAAGFVNFMGYLGAFGGDAVTGYLLHHYDWTTVLVVWAGWAFGAALLAMLLWNATARQAEKENEPR